MSSGFPTSDDADDTKERFGCLPTQGLSLRAPTE